MKKQEAPFAVQIEPVEGCNLRCTFCGLNGIRGKDNNFKFMSLTTAQVVAQGIAQAGWNCRLEFAMHGEPTQHPDLPGLVAVFRQHLPKAYMLLECNGSGLVKDPVGRLQALYQAGMDTVAVDEYEQAKWAQQIRTKLGAAAMPDRTSEMRFMVGEDVDYYEYPREPNGNPHRRHHRRRLVFIAPINTAVEGTHSTLNNHAGAGAPPKALQARCAKPFRELSVRWDGNVAVCCNDWRGEYPVGNVTQGVEAVWNSPAMQAARVYLYHGQRSGLHPCNKCDATSYRVGLLPDKKGKDTLPLPTARHRKAVLEAEANGPLTPPVLRPWEVGDA